MSDATGALTGSDAPASSRRPAIAWNWSLFLLGAIYAVPAMIATPHNPTVGLGLAVGVLPVAAFTLPAARRGRRAVVIVGVVCAVCFVIGAIITQVPVLALAALFALAVVFAQWSRRGRAGLMAMILGLPLVGIGLSFDVSTAATAAALMVAGAAYAWGVSMLWPESPQPAAAPAPRGAPSRNDMLLYGVLLGAAAVSAAGIGYALNLEHIGWATGAALLVMRPAQDQLLLRSVGRAASVSLGALAAASFAELSAGGVVTALVVGVVLAALTATTASRWYVTPGFTTFVAITLILQRPGEDPAGRFWERVIETGIGVGVALLFGALVPALIRALRRRRLGR